MKCSICGREAYFLYSSLTFDNSTRDLTEVNFNCTYCMKEYKLEFIDNKEKNMNKKEEFETLVNLKANADHIKKMHKLFANSFIDPASIPIHYLGLDLAKQNSIPLPFRRDREVGNIVAHTPVGEFRIVEWWNAKEPGKIGPFISLVTDFMPIRDFTSIAKARKFAEEVYEKRMERMKKRWFR